MEVDICPYLHVRPKFDDFTLLVYNLNIHEYGTQNLSTNETSSSVSRAAMFDEQKGKKRRQCLLKMLIVETGC